MPVRSARRGREKMPMVWMLADGMLRKCSVTEPIGDCQASPPGPLDKSIPGDLGLARVEEEFKVAFGAREAARLDRDVLKIKGPGGGLDRPDGSCMECGVGDDAAGSYVLAPQLELWLDEDQEVGMPCGATDGGGKNLGDGDKRDVGDDQVHERGQIGGLKFASVAFDLEHARLLLEFPVELRSVDVHGVHLRGSVLQQAVGEASIRRAQVEASPS